VRLQKNGSGPELTNSNWKTALCNYLNLKKMLRGSNEGAQQILNALGNSGGY
jgi:hypothetical protein